MERTSSGCDDTSSEEVTTPIMAQLLVCGFTPKTTVRGIFKCVIKGQVGRNALKKDLCPLFNVYNFSQSFSSCYY